MISRLEEAVHAAVEAQRALGLSLRDVEAASIAMLEASRAADRGMARELGCEPHQVDLVLAGLPPDTPRWVLDYPLLWRESPAGQAHSLAALLSGIPERPGWRPRLLASLVTLSRRFA